MINKNLCVRRPRPSRGAAAGVIGGRGAHDESLSRVVILPSDADADDADGYVADLLAPHDENLTAEPYWADYV